MIKKPKIAPLDIDSSLPTSLIIDAIEKSWFHKDRYFPWLFCSCGIFNSRNIDTKKTRIVLIYLFVRYLDYLDFGLRRGSAIQILHMIVVGPKWPI